MADIELVIKMDEKDYHLLKKGLLLINILDVIKNGPPLPKGHGDLIDIDDIKVVELEDSLHVIRHEKGDDVDVYIDAATVVEADKEK